MGTDNGDATTGEKKAHNDNWGEKGTQRRGGQKSKGTGRLAAIKQRKLRIL